MELNHGGAVIEEYQEIRSIFNSGRDHSGISAVLFDPLEELVWTANQSVGLDSMYCIGENVPIILIFYMNLFNL